MDNPHRYDNYCRCKSCINFPKIIEEFPGSQEYMIYPNGDVLSLKTDIIMKTSNHKDGYKMIGMKDENGKQVMRYVHRLVAKYFIPNPRNLNEVDHINRDETDNRIENLRWVTHAENLQNKGKYKNNKSGHKYISYHNPTDRWQFQKRINGKIINKTLKTKTDALCYKFVALLMLKSQIPNTGFSLK